MPRKEKFRKLKSEGIAIVGDGLCEKLYFDQMKAAEKLTSNIEPKLPKAGSWSTVFETVDKLLSNAAYSHIYCLIDYANYGFKSKKIKNTATNRPQT